jgi:hypothetical protein
LKNISRTGGQKGFTLTAYPTCELEASQEAKRQSHTLCLLAKNSLKNIKRQEECTSLPVLIGQENISKETGGRRCLLQHNMCEA